ncbi:tetratricopeptide repeat protein [Streptomyces sp. NPDC060194]|uniref:tetratricopeptide repeat protein n=1 Tax=Streptomyces sp. NPDC060194 TaxID=3347069 RepID=UPI00364AC75D
MTDQAVASAAGQLFGRRRELKELREDIERAGLDTLSGRKAPRARVLLIAGPPGSGRTALASHLAGELAADYPDGVLRARLRTPDGEAVPVGRTARELLGALELPAPPGADDDLLTELLRTALAGRTALLLLDDAVDSEQVDALLPDNPACLAVVVARGPLTGIPDVRPCTLGGLETPAALELLGRAAGEVRLTVDPQSAESLVEACAHRPAALVLAGGWLAARPQAAVADAVKQLDEQAARPEAPADPVARAFDLVHASLPEAAARILRLLSLAPAGLVDPQTASALAGCSVGAAQSTLEDFAALGLLRPQGASPPQYEVPGALMPLLTGLREARDRPAEVQLARARMLERTVRQLQACRAVSEPEGSEARRRLAGLPRSLRFPNARAGGEWLRAREPALLAAARLATEDGDLDTLARRLTAALVRALIIYRGPEEAAPELYHLHHLVLDVAERRDLHRERAAALLNLGDLDAATGRTEDALHRYRAALDAGREAKDPHAVARAMESVAGAHQELGDWPRAADWYGRALESRLGRDELADEARLYGRLGTVHTYAGRYGEALRAWRAAAAAHRRRGDVGGHARALSETARVQEYAGRPEEALFTCRDAVELARAAGDDRLQAGLQLRLADTLERLGDPAAAQLHRSAADRLLGEGDAGGQETGVDREDTTSACEIRSTAPGD